MLYTVSFSGNIDNDGFSEVVEDVFDELTSTLENLESLRFELEDVIDDLDDRIDSINDRIQIMLAAFAGVHHSSADVHTAETIK